LIPKCKFDVTDSDGDYAIFYKTISKQKRSGPAIRIGEANM
jgi:hypothetical protein